MIINTKKIVVSFMALYFGFTSQNTFASTTYQLGQEDLISKSQYLNKLAPEFNELSDKWRTIAASEIEDSNYPDHVQIITGFPGQDRTDGTGRTYQSYRPKFSSEYQLDTLILTRAANGLFLDNYWTPNGLSCYVFLSRDGTAFIHADILKNEKGQMVGKHNNHSLTVAFVDNDDHQISETQTKNLKNLIEHLSSKDSSKMNIQYGASIYEIKQADGEPGFESGAVSNMNDIRTYLNLQPYKAS